LGTYWTFLVLTALQIEDNRHGQPFMACTLLQAPIQESNDHVMAPKCHLRLTQGLRKAATGFATELRSLFRSQSDFIIRNLQEGFSATDKLNNTLGTAHQLPILPPPALEASTEYPTDDDFSFGIVSIEEVNDIQEQRESTEKVFVKENSLIPQEKLTQFLFTVAPDVIWPPN